MILRGMGVRHWRIAAVGVFVPCVAFAVPVDSDSDMPLEVIIVSAQRTDQNVQEVPIAVTALPEAVIEDRQIVTYSDLQMNVPNLSYTNQNFGGGMFSIRGIGRLIYTPDGEAGVSTHVNDVALPLNLVGAEFVDMERIEVLRGPQGTLYGRNATGGVINAITRRPDFDGVGGFADLEAGDYDHVRVQGALNLPLLDTLAVRLTGMSLERDGYTNNKAGGQVPGVDDDVDGRDLYQYRVTLEWRPTDAAGAWLMYLRFQEDDDRSRITNQVCKQNAYPTAGCMTDAFGLEPVHPGSTVGGMFAGLLDAVPLGARDEAEGLVYAYPRPSIGLRDVHTDLEPVYEDHTEAWLGGVEYDFDAFRLVLLGGYQDTDFASRQDYLMDVGFDLNPTVENPSGIWPTSEPPDGPGRLFASSPCAVQDYHAGIFGGCVANVDQSRVFAFDQSAWETDYWTAEARVQSNLDGPWNVLLGVNYTDSKSDGDYYVMANTLDAASLYGIPPLQFPPIYPGYFASSTSPDGGTVFEGYSAFGELYWQATDRLKFTLGLRYNDDEKKTNETEVLFNSFDVNALSGGALGPDPIWVRVAMGSWLSGSPTDEAIWLAERYGATDAILSATSPAEFIAALQRVPPAPAYNEARAFDEADDRASWTALTGRFGCDWTFDEQHMAYVYYSRGHKPGGFNPPGTDQATYDSESVDAIEIGSKNLFAESSLMLNAAAFYYDYDGLQTTRSAGLISFQDGMDTEILGAELEGSWRPSFMAELQLDFAYAWLDTRIKGGQWVDEASRTQGNPDYVLLKNVQPDNHVGLNFIAPIAEVLPLVDQAIATAAALPAPGTVYPNGIPAYFREDFLEASGVAVSSGIPADLHGNSLPNAPEHSVHLGIAYTWSPPIGALTARWDYYWQDASYAREFNRPGDQIDSWDQQNASLIFEPRRGHWQLRAWVRNLTNEENVTGQFLTGDTSGLFRNYFLTEPRIYGGSVRYTFGSG